MLNQHTICTRVKKKLKGKFTMGDIDTVSRALFEIIVDAVENGEEVSVPGFGRFYARFIKGRMIKKTGIPWIKGQHQIKSRFLFGFKPGEAANRAAAKLTAKLNIDTPPAK